MLPWAQLWEPLGALWEPCGSPVTSCPRSAYIDKASDTAEQEILIDSQLNSPEGLAIDWVHKNIYWTDSGNKTISVATADGRRRRTLFNSDLSEPRAIAVDPTQRWVWAPQTPLCHHRPSVTFLCLWQTWGSFISPGLQMPFKMNSAMGLWRCFN